MYSKNLKSDFIDYSDEELIKLISIDSNALNEIISRYAQRILIKSNAMTSSFTDRDDLIQEGFLGLMNAIYNFNEDKGVKFSCFADVCIQNRMNTAIKKLCKTQLFVISQENILGQYERNLNFVTFNTPESILIQKDTFCQVLSMLSKNLSECELQVLML